jgi:16S rRNA (guanine527-N7)-methyltransferase
VLALLCCYNSIGFSDYRGRDQLNVNAPESIPQPEHEALGKLLAAESIDVSFDQLVFLDRYRRLLWSWNERLNLTRHTTLEKFVGRDVVDSFEISKLLKRGERVLDVGSGGGVPGVLLAILRPDLAVTLCESTQKKARALEAIVGELGLNAPVYATRAEDVLEINTFDTLVARGLASLPKVLTWLAPHWEAFDQLLLVKGPKWVDERSEARQHGLLRGLELRKAAAYQTPLTGAESVILKIWRPDKL